MQQRTEKEIMRNWKGDKGAPFVSICTITYNQEKYIAKTIESFLMQETTFPFEIIIHDDASIDSTREILLKYYDLYPKLIKLILQKENQYSQGKRVISFIFEKVKGKYLALCEGDDYWTDPLKLQYQFSLMEEYPDCHISFHPAFELIEGVKSEKILSKYCDKNHVFDVSTIISGGGGFCPTASLMINASVTHNLPALFYNAPVGDYFLQVFSSINGGALYLNKAMSIYRKGHKNSWSAGVKTVEKQLEAAYKFAESLEKLNKYTNKKYKRYIMHEMSRQFFFPSLQSFEEGRSKKLREILFSYNIKYRRWDMINYLIIICFFFKVRRHMQIKLLKLFYFKENNSSPRLVNKNDI